MAVRRLFIYTDHLVLSTFLRRLCFHREDISQIERYHGIFSGGLRIVHTVASYPRHVVFWTRDVAELEDVLRVGCRVTGVDANKEGVTTASQMAGSGQP